MAVGFQSVQLAFPVLQRIHRGQIGAGGLQSIRLFGPLSGVLAHLPELGPAFGQLFGLQGGELHPGGGALGAELLLGLSCLGQGLVKGVQPRS